MLYNAVLMSPNKDKVMWMYAYKVLACAVELGHSCPIYTNGYESSKRPHQSYHW